MRLRGSGGKKLVAVVAPVVGFPLSGDEEISMRHLRKYLGAYDRYIIGPARLPDEYSDFKLKRFAAECFGGVYAYNRLLLTEKFYRAFTEYEYILIYQMDCLVFADQLEEWCGKGWDYVGAPWLKNELKAEEGFYAVGNGGLSLRRVSSALAVLRSKVPVDDPEVRGAAPGRSKFIYERLSADSAVRRVIRGVKTRMHRHGYKNNVAWRTEQLASVNHHEDYFWAEEAGRFVEEFRIPGWREGLEFSFEVAPRYCLEMNGGRLPFGCHAWNKYDRGFWEQYLVRGE